MDRASDATHPINASSSVDDQRMSKEEVLHITLMLNHELLAAAQEASGRLPTGTRFARDAGRHYAAPLQSAAWRGHLGASATAAAAADKPDDSVGIGRLDDFGGAWPLS
jgi:hypothetical protein